MVWIEEQLVLRKHEHRQKQKQTNPKQKVRKDSTKILIFFKKFFFFFFVVQNMKGIRQKEKKRENPNREKWCMNPKRIASYIYGKKTSLLSLSDSIYNGTPCQARVRTVLGRMEVAAVVVASDQPVYPFLKAFVVLLDDCYHLHLRLLLKLKTTTLTFTNHKCSFWCAVHSLMVYFAHSKGFQTLLNGFLGLLFLRGFRFIC